MAVTSLVTACAQQLPDAFASCVPRAVDRLRSIVMEREYSPDYIYYKVPNPWLQVKLLRLLQYYPPPGECFAILKRKAPEVRIDFRCPFFSPSRLCNTESVERSSKSDHC